MMPELERQRAQADKPAVTLSKRPFGCTDLPSFEAALVCKLSVFKSTL